MDKWLKIAIIAGIIVIAGSVLYYFVFYIPEQRRDQEAKLDTCLVDAEATKNARWNGDCERQGREEECPLSSEKVESYYGRYEDDRDACFKRYSPN